MNKPNPGEIQRPFAIGQTKRKMNTVALQKKQIPRGLFAGLCSGLFFVLLWPLGSILASGILLLALNRRKTKYSQEDALRFFAAFLLTMMLCNIMMNREAFRAGVIDGWNAGAASHTTQ